MNRSIVVLQVLLFVVVTIIVLLAAESTNARNTAIANPAAEIPMPMPFSLNTSLLASELPLPCEPLPAWPTGEKIAFVSSRDGRHQIYLMNPDGTDQVRLCTLHGAISPRWSSDAAKLVFVSNGHICVMYADGSHQRDLGPGLEPDWSSNGTKIVFTIGDQGIHTMNPDGSEIAQLTHRDDRVPKWSPDGNQIAFNRHSPGENREIFLMDMDADGADATNITNSEADDVNPAWSPDGAKIAFQYITDAWVMNADGSNRVNIGGNGDQSWLTWSMDGAKLAFTMYGFSTAGWLGNNNEIWVMESDGSNRVNITNHSSHDSQPAWSRIPVPSSAPPPPTSTLTPTTTGNVTINGGAYSATSINVTLVASASNSIDSVDQMSFSNDGSSWNEWRNYETSLTSWSLLTGDGVKTVYGRFRDAVGNALLVISDTIGLDTTAGTDYGLTINNGEIFTNKMTVTLTIGAQPGTARMQVSNDGGFALAEWEPYASRKDWQITRHGVYVIPRVVYVRYQDINGNISATYQDDIILDVNAPTGSVEIVPLSSSGHRLRSTNVISVALYLSAEDDGSGVADMMIGNRSDFASASWEPFVTARSWSVPEGTLAYVYVRFRDNAGNISETCADVTGQAHIYLPLVTRSFVTF